MTSDEVGGVEALLDFFPPDPDPPIDDEDEDAEADREEREEGSRDGDRVRRAGGREFEDDRGEKNDVRRDEVEGFARLDDEGAGDRRGEFVA